MTKHSYAFGWSAALAAAFSLAGCNGQPAEETGVVGDTPPDTVATGHDDHEGHDHGAHPEHGPNGGDLIELGEEEYHAELVHDSGTVAIYILDSAAKEAVPIEATDVTINLKQDGKPEQFKLTAAPQEGDGEGKASRFTVEDADLASHLDEEGAGARLMVTIAGKSFNGAIEHHHGHEGHEH